MNDPGLHNKVVIITGASQGIGLATSRLLAGKGATVVLAARDFKKLDQAGDLIKNGGGLVLTIPTDVRQEGEVRALVHQVQETCGRIDVLINNAGVLVYGPVATTDVGDWDRVMETNLKGAFLCSREVLPIMIRQRSGQIINIASGAGENGFPNLAVYCASKFGLIGFSKAMALEAAASPVKISYLSPGYVDTPMLRHFPEEIIKTVSPARPEEVAERILQLILNPDSSEKSKGLLKSALKKGVQWMTSKKSD
jgi:NAD(P)-dependent dehydrogenase (short-subunit alcohol dehydrogenase family)